MAQVLTVFLEITILLMLPTPFLIYASKAPYYYIFEKVRTSVTNEVIKPKPVQGRVRV